ncbi:unnamed protein product [Bursaphelenchus okinawaensis]|uniref:Uncharacterized protein n=1 Tax=Bursaphelenchus okinawaensis TaxID=465554 RepID=A0A811KM27_9BILA|nr:unnamed protein product [Bursaphelenchus okinawaensis]CAG9106363.1 unnamed protein product [Bursaphelenchus okinawaensis]
MASPEFDGCTTDFISPLVGFLVLAECCISIVSLLLNCTLAGAISLNYVLISGVVLARSLFVGFIAYSTCNTTVSTANCKIQEFPLVFVYFQAAFFPALLAIQFFFKQNHRVRQINYLNACSITQLLISVFCLAIALWFTAFDHENRGRYLKHCLIVRAIHEKRMAFAMFTALLSIQLFSLFMWLLIQRQVSNQQQDQRVRSLSEEMVGENVGWCLILFLSGFIGVYEYIYDETNESLISAALESSFVLAPLFLSLFRAISILWNVEPIRLSILNILPGSSYFLQIDYDKVYQYNREVSGLEKAESKQ